LFHEANINNLLLLLDLSPENQIGLKYYILPETSTYETDFRKITHGGIQGYRYKDLRDYLTLSDYNDVKLIADELRKVTWK
jgi:hypothetical protein